MVQNACGCFPIGKFAWFTYVHNVIAHGPRKGIFKMEKNLSTRGQSLAAFFASLVCVFHPSQNRLNSLADVLIHYFTVILCIPLE